MGNQLQYNYYRDFMILSQGPCYSTAQTSSNSMLRGSDNKLVGCKIVLNFLNNFLSAQCWYKSKQIRGSMTQPRWPCSSVHTAPVSGNSMLCGSDKRLLSCKIIFIYTPRSKKSTYCKRKNSTVDY